MQTVEGHRPRVPTELRVNLRRRRSILAETRKNRRYRRALVTLCKRDIVGFANLLVWQYNPDNVGDEIGPWITWGWQGDVLKRTMTRLFKKGRSDMLWEKSREMGATWLACILIVHLCLFSPNKRVLCLSHKEEAIHKPGDTKGTLFAKIDFILDHLPKWMSAGVRRNKLSYTFPNGSAITGAATTDAAGVGDRCSLIVLDEFSKYRQKQAYEIWGATADTGPRLVIGTHYGVSGCYYDLSQRKDMPKEVMHWTLHPEKVRGLYRSDPTLPNGFEVLDKEYAFPPDYDFNRTGKPFDGPEHVVTPYYSGPAVGIRSPWYDAECKRRANDRDVAQHLDIAPRQSQHNYFDSVMVATLQEATREPLGEYDVRLDPVTGDPIGLVPTEGGAIKLWINPTEMDANGLVTELPPDDYGMGADISQGSGASNSVCSVGSKTTGRKVCEVAVHNLDPRDFALVCIALGRMFKNHDGRPALLNWEVNGPGGLFGRVLREKKYTRVFMRETKDMIRGNSVSEVPGYNMSVQGAKRNLLDQYTIALRDRLFVNLSYDAFEDCKAYRFSDTKDTVEHPKHAGGPDPSGARSNHGDRVIADALCVASLKRLGLGKVTHQTDEIDPEAPVVVGTLEWRMKLAAQQEYGDRRARPIRAMRGLSRRRWK
jgi:hypothetical protein